jgi:hypothetical protein
MFLEQVQRCRSLGKTRFASPGIAVPVVRLLRSVEAQRNGDVFFFENLQNRPGKQKTIRLQSNINLRRRSDGSAQFSREGNNRLRPGEERFRSNIAATSMGLSLPDE